MQGIEKHPRDDCTPGSNSGSKNSSTSMIINDDLVVVPCSGSTKQNTPSQPSPEDEVVLETPERPTGSVLNQTPTATNVDIHCAVSARMPTKLSEPTVSSRQSLVGSAVKGVLLGTWRDSTVPDIDKKHAVIGFIDARGSLHTQIQPNTKHEESLAKDYPVPSGQGGNRVTFDKVVFSDHLVGLNRFEVKEYTRLRSIVDREETEGDRVAAEHAAVQEAKRRVKENPKLQNLVQPPAIAHGAILQDHFQAPVRSELKRKRLSGGFAAINSAPPGIAAEPNAFPNPQQSNAAHQNQFTINPLPRAGTTRILIGYWRPSSEVNEKDRHAVYGILSQNDVFRVKVVRETRDGRYVDGNFPSGSGALWIPYEDVEFEPHLKALNRQEVKEYCRFRQHQLDHGERDDSRIENEVKAVNDAQNRVSTEQSRKITVSTFTSSLRGGVNDFVNGRHGNRHIKPRPSPASLSGNEPRLTRPQSVEAGERACSVARRDIAPDDARIYDGMRYERKAAGPFQGGLVSQGTIINIDGEDYVEYRVLTKPSFF